MIDIIPTIVPWEGSVFYVIDTMLAMGISTFRINFKWMDFREGIISSKCTLLKSQLKKIMEYNPDIKLIFDIGYPKDTIRSIVDCPEKCLHVRKGDEILIAFERNRTISNGVRFDYQDISLKENETIIYGDGNNSLQVVRRIGDNKYLARVAADGDIWTNKAFHFLPEIVCETEQADVLLSFINSFEESFKFEVALSFVESAQEIESFKKKMTFSHQVIAKIESQRGIENLDDILQQTSCAMLGRGDLIFNSNVMEFLDNQNRFLTLCKKRGAYSIVATGVLPSLVNNIVPSRSDLTDLQYIINSGCSAVALAYDVIVSPFFGDFFHRMRSCGCW